MEEEIRKFESGAVRGSGGKFDFPEYISPHLIFRFAEHMRKNAVKYGAGNWKKKIPENEYFKSLCRHFFMLYMEKTEGIVWFWIGTHDEYNKMISYLIKE